MAKIVLTAAIIFGSVGSLIAQANVHIGVFASASFVGGSREFLMNSNTALRTEYANGGKLGFRVGMDLKQNWAGEVSYSFGPNNLRAINLNPPRSEREFDTRVHQFLFNGVYHFA